jgi:hypothetical protein
MAATGRVTTANANSIVQKAVNAAIHAVAICHNRMFDAPTSEGNPFVPIGDAVREALGIAG